MDLRSLSQYLLSEVSSEVIGFQIELHSLITWLRIQVYFKIIESLRTCIMASQNVFNFNSNSGGCIVTLQSVSMHAPGIFYVL